MEDEILKMELKSALTGEKAHITFDHAVDDFPVDKINIRVGELPYTAWQLADHIRYCLTDILDFIRNPDYKEPDWPADYWTSQEGDPASWSSCIQQFREERQVLTDMIDQQELSGPLPHAPEYSLVREVLIMANHISYHTGQLMVLKRML